MKKNINFSLFSSIKIGPFLEVEILENELLPENYYLIGGCNNILISNEPKDFNFSMLGKNFSFIEKTNEGIRIGGATKSNEILKFAKENNLFGFELLKKLPGTLGGMLKMNAGLKEWEISNHLIKIKTNDGWIDKKDIEFGYRFANINGVIFEAIFEEIKGFDVDLFNFMQNLRLNQPKFPSCGSCFKNPLNFYAGKLIEDVGLKGKRIGNMAFSEKHGNFLINLGNGNFKDSMNLINLAKKRVFDEFGINLENEIIII